MCSENLNNTLTRADLHVHSSYSDDGLVHPQRILEIAKKKHIDTVAITDHNTIKGALKAKQYEQKYGIRVIIGAEIHTDIGDLIGLNLKDEITSYQWEEVIKAIKAQGGVAVLPHPFRSHKCIPEVAAKVDFIEVFNSRCTEVENRRAYELATDLGKPMIYGSDAHLGIEIGNVIVKIHDGDLLSHHIIKTDYARQSHILASYAYGCFKRGQLIGLTRDSINYMRRKLFSWFSI